MMKIRILFWALFLCICGGQAEAVSRAQLTRQCKQIMAEHPADVQIFYNFGGLQFDRSKSSEELALLRQEIMPNLISVGKVEGLTTLLSYFELSVQASFVELSGGYKCFYPQAVRIKTGYSEPVVFLAEHLQDGTCDYLKTLRHEMEHLDFGHIALNLFVEQLKNRAPIIVEEAGVHISQDEEIEEASRKLYQLYISRFEPMFNLFKDTLAAQNMLLDSKENYHKESLLCR